MNESYRRQHPRVSSLNLADVHILDENGIANCGIGRTLNVSESGILLETHFPIEPERLLALTIAFGEDILEIKGKVVYSNKCDNGKYQNGVRFTQHDEKTALPILRSLTEIFGEQAYSEAA